MRQRKRNSEEKYLISKTSEEQIYKEGHKRKEEERSRGRRDAEVLYLVLLNIAIFTLW